MLKKLSKRIMTFGLSLVLTASLVFGIIPLEKVQAADYVDRTKEDTATFSINAFNNLDYTFPTIDGGTVSSKVLPSKDVTLLIFGRTTCGTTWFTLERIADSSWIHDTNVSVIYIEIDGADAQTIQDSIDFYSRMSKDAESYYRGCEKITFCHDADGKNEDSRKMYHMLSGKWEPIYLPMIVMVDKNNIVREILSNSQSADDILSVINQVKNYKEAVKPENVYLSKEKVTWNGKERKPSIIAKDGQGNEISKTDYIVTYSNNKNVGRAMVNVTFKNGYTGTIKKTFTINPKGTSISKVSATKKGFTVKWKQQKSQTTGYEIQYSTSSKFKGAKTLKNIKAKVTSKKVTKLKAKKKYYVRIRTYKEAKVNGKSTKMYSEWSKAKSVVTKK